MEFIEKYYRPDFAGSQIGELGLRYCGRRVDAPDHRFGPAARENYWLIYLCKGSGRYETGGLTHRLREGELFCAFPGRRICYEADKGSVWTIYWLSLAGERVGEYLSLAGISENEPVAEVIDPERTVGLFESLLGTISDETLGAKLTASALVYSLLSEISSGAAIEQKHDYFDDAMLYMSNNYDSPITIADIARRLSIDRSYFSRIFRERTGVSPCEWLSEIRLKRACELLTLGELSVSEIARSVGYNDPLYFTRIFKKRLGCSPSEYRRTDPGRVRK